MNVILTYKITESESGRSIAAFLLDSGYSSALWSTCGTPRKVSSKWKTVFPTQSSAGGLPGRPCYGEKASEQIVPVPTDLSVVFEDEHVLVIDKPAGMPVHPSQGHYENTLANAIAWYFRNEETPFVFRAVNRLDRYLRAYTSGKESLQLLYSIRCREGSCDPQEYAAIVS